MMTGREALYAINDLLESLDCEGDAGVTMTFKHSQRRPTTELLDSLQTVV